MSEGPYDIYCVSSGTRMIMTKWGEMEQTTMMKLSFAGWAWAWVEEDVNCPLADLFMIFLAICLDSLQSARRFEGSISITDTT